MRLIGEHIVKSRSAMSEEEQAIKENRQRIEVLKIENMKDNARSLSQQMTIVKKL